MSQATALDVLFLALEGRQPYQWQRAAFERLCSGCAPRQIKVPTSAGKTMMLAIWLAALAHQSSAGTVTLPRRLVHTVNRRVLVDEATRLAHRLQQVLDADPSLGSMRSALQRLSATDMPLVVSTLRGGLEDNGAWAEDPSTPAIVLATPDMLGSRLLFRGYGLGRSRAATHAGLLGCDTMVVHDEAHLAPAFTRLLRQVASRSKPGAATIGRPPLTVVEMTATLAQGAADDALECRVSDDPALSLRMVATKRLQLIDARLQPSKASKAAAMVTDAIASAALAEQVNNRAVAIFVGTPAVAEQIAGRLVKAGVEPARVALLTGTMRGYERSQLSLSPAFARFSPGPDRVEDGTSYFIATSAGEIGLDIDADVGLFDLSTLDRFIQRAGRVNRRGVALGRIDLTHAGGDEAPEVLVDRCRKSLAVLQSLPTVDGSADACPQALSALCDLPDYADAASPGVAIRALESSVVDMLSMTSMRLEQLGCPAPEVFIHGVVEATEQLAIAWRLLPANGADMDAWLDAWPVQPVELASLPIDPARRLLKERLHALRSQVDGVLALGLDGQGMPVSQVVAGDNIDRWVNRLPPGAAVLLDQRAGGLSVQGLPSPEATAVVPDVTAQMGGGAAIAASQLLQVEATCTVGDDAVAWQGGEHSSPSLDGLLAELCPVGYTLAFHDGPRQLDGTGWRGTIKLWLQRRGVLSPDLGDAASLSTRSRLLSEHLDLTGAAANRLCSSLGLAAPWHSAITRSGVFHDGGKAWPRWQAAIGNRDKPPLGKSSHKRFDFKINDGYRHELGSLVGLGDTPAALERHLVAAHHGWSRPNFSDDARNKPGCGPAADRAALTFEGWSSALGPWALAYLEAVLKAADVHAEVYADQLAESIVPLPTCVAPPLNPPHVASAEFRLRLDASNFGEYLAALGLAAACERQGHTLLLGWQASEFVLQGVDAEAVVRALSIVVRGTIDADVEATTAATTEAAYPPLLLRLSDGSTWPLNHWLDERLLTASRWKLGAGQTTAAKTLASTMSACAALLDHPGFDASSLFRQGGGIVGADASKFRFDAATNWSARDAGFSLNESDAFKSTRPWVELLSALGLQRFFLPPSDKTPVYFQWHGQLPPMLALAAAKGLLPQSHSGLRPVITPNGKMKDVFTSKPIVREERSTCPTSVLVI